MDIRELEENSTPLDVDQPTPDQVEEPKVVERSRDRRKTKTTDDPLKRSKQLEQLKLARQRKKELNEQKKQKRLEVEARITKEIEKEEEFIEKKDEERAPITSLESMLAQEPSVKGSTEVNGEEGMDARTLCHFLLYGVNTV